MRGFSRVDAILLIATLISIIPFWSGALLLSTDLPQHLAHAAIARDFGDRGLAAFYLVDLSPRPYLGTTYLLIVLGADQLAGRIALTLYAIALVLSVRMLVRSAPDRDPRLVWFAPLFVSSWPVAYGFLPFVFGLPPAIAAVALARRGSLIVAGAFHWIALLFHPIAFAIGALATVPMFRERPRSAWPIAAALLFFLAPAPETLEFAQFGDDHIHTVWRFQIKHKVLDYALAYLPGHLDTVCAVPGALALAVAAIAHRKMRARDNFDLAALAVALLYLFAPADLALGGAKISLLGPRILLAAWLFAIVAGPPKLHRVAAIAPLISTLALSIVLALAAHRYGEAWGGPVAAAVGALPNGARMKVELATPKRSWVNTNLLAPPEVHLHAYSMLERARFDPLLFSTRHSAVQIHAAVETDFDVTWTQSSTPAISIRHRE